MKTPKRNKSGAPAAVASSAQFGSCDKSINAHFGIKLGSKRWIRTERGIKTADRRIAELREQYGDPLPKMTETEWLKHSRLGRMTLLRLHELGAVDCRLDKRPNPQRSEGCASNNKETNER